jgi:CBS domain-containing protein
MKVKDVMTGTAYFCHRGDNLGMAAEMMWKGNCGFLAVVDETEKMCGVLTDRDICIALCTRNKRAGDARVGEVMQDRVHLCHADDDIHMALQSMREAHVRRLPVMDAKGRLAGVLSIEDVIVHAEPTSLGRQPELSADETVRTYRKILQKELLTVRRAAA